MADADEFDPWATTSGLVDDIDITISDAYFGFNADYNNGETLVLTIEGTTDDEDNKEYSGFYPCGGGWETTDKGKTASREDGKRKGFNKTSGYGLFFTAAIEAGAGDVLRERGTPFEAAVWPGLTFHMKRLKHNYGGEIGEIERLLPVEFKGVAGEGGAKPAKATGATKKAAPTKAEPEGEADEAGAASSNGELPVPLKAKLKKLARECETHDQFIERAYTEVDGVDGNTAAEEAVMDPDGLYAEAHA